MLINHLDLHVADVSAHITFFERLFGLTCQSNRTSPKLAILSDEAGFVLVLQRKIKPDETYPEGFHLGFLVPDLATVDAVLARAQADGITTSGLIHNNRGVLLYVRAPEGFSVEVSVRRAPQRDT